MNLKLPKLKPTVEAELRDIERELSSVAFQGRYGRITQKLRERSAIIGLRLDRLKRVHERRRTIEKRISENGRCKAKTASGSRCKNPAGSWSWNQGELGRLLRGADQICAQHFRQRALKRVSAEAKR